MVMRGRDTSLDMYNAIAAVGLKCKKEGMGMVLLRIFG